MKTIKILLLSLVLFLQSCVLDVPVDTSRGPNPFNNPEVLASVPYVSGHNDGRYYNGGYGSNYYGGGNVIQHGDPRQHRYGNGPQTYITGFPPPGGYDPNFNYGMGGRKYKRSR